ncbi:MAG: hypothetical protein GC151_03595 [Betaproteobacteria bacterium]|nr:hypothetical protein [Betaproteobacteria bacterium]
MSNRVHSALLCVCLLVPACSTIGDPGGRLASGTVTGVFTEPYTGILVDRTLGTRQATTDPVWVEVDLRQPLTDGRRTVQARIEDRDVPVGAIVDVTLAPETATPDDPAIEGLAIPGRNAARPGAEPARRAAPFPIARVDRRFELRVE